jgi:hypothetical protein
MTSRNHGGENQGWPRWLRQRVASDNVNLRLYEYGWHLHERSQMPLIKSVKTDSSEWFDSSELQEGHYTPLSLTGHSEYTGSFDVEIKKPPRPSISLKRCRLMFPPYPRTTPVVTSSFRRRNIGEYRRFLTRDLRHNIEACVPSRTTSPPLLLVPSRMKRRVPTLPAHASGAPSVVGRRTTKTAGFVPVGTGGTYSIPGECALPAFTNGLQPRASSVAGGRRILIGMRLCEKEETIK